MGIAFLCTLGDGPQGPEAARRRFMALPAPPVETPHLLKTARLTVNKDHVDLSQGETPETTTTIGLKLLEQFRKTIDKQYVLPPFYIHCDDSIITIALSTGADL
jgi:hypothetical protein